MSFKKQWIDDKFHRSSHIYNWKEIFSLVSHLKHEIFKSDDENDIIYSYAMHF